MKSPNHLGLPVKKETAEASSMSLSLSQRFCGIDVNVFRVLF